MQVVSEHRGEAPDLVTKDCGRRLRDGAPVVFAVVNGFARDHPWSGLFGV